MLGRPNYKKRWLTASRLLESEGKKIEIVEEKRYLVQKDTLLLGAGILFVLTGVVALLVVGTDNVKIRRQATPPPAVTKVEVIKEVPSKIVKNNRITEEQCKKISEGDSFFDVAQEYGVPDDPTADYFVYTLEDTDGECFIDFWEMEVNSVSIQLGG